MSPLGTARSMMSQTNDPGTTSKWWTIGGKMADCNQNSRGQTRTTEERFAVDVARGRWLISEEMLTGGRALSELIYR
jgi:hypothetical protein